MGLDGHMGKDMTRKKKTTKKTTKRAPKQKPQPDPFTDPKVDFTIDHEGQPWLLIGKLAGYKTFVIAQWDARFGQYEVLAKGIGADDLLMLRKIFMHLVQMQKNAVAFGRQEVEKLKQLVAEQQEMLRNGSKRVRGKGATGAPQQGTKGGKRKAQAPRSRARKAS